MDRTNVLGTVTQTGLVIFQTESRPQVTFLCSVVAQSHGAAKKQKCVALSTAEAEYVALSGAIQECLWLRQLEAELGCPPEGPTLMFEDNQSMIAMAKNLQFHGRAKHTSICHHFVREKAANGTIKFRILPSN